MDADGGNVRRLTDAPGYDGGAFFSPDCTADRLARLAPRQGRGAGGLPAAARPGPGAPEPKLELWVANADGADARQIT
jgi:Tol biopolymer transport system component